MIVILRESYTLRKTAANHVANTDRNQLAKAELFFGSVKRFFS
jgi:hypothetical protein